MRWMRWIGWLVLLLAGASVLLRQYWNASPSIKPATSQREEPTDGPVVRVKTVALRQEMIEEKLVVYGTVVAALGKSQIISVPFECRVRQTFVTAGETVETGKPLIEIEASSETELQIRQARSELQSAQAAERLAHESFTMKLTTRQELNVAEQRLSVAQTALQNLIERGASEPRQIAATAAGVVLQINAQAGQIVAAGSPLLELIGQNQINVRLGIEYEDVGNLHIDKDVTITPVHNGEGRIAAGKIRLITQQMNPQTRLIDVYVAPESNPRLMLNEYVRGQIIVAAQQALVAPRSAVLPEEDHHVLYTVEQGHAVRHEIKLGIENDRQLQIFGEGLQVGQPIVVAGNSELQDGMAVELEPGL